MPSLALGPVPGSARVVHKGLFHGSEGIRLYSHPYQIPANSTLTLPSASCPFSAPDLHVIKSLMEEDTVYYREDILLQSCF